MKKMCLSMLFVLLTGAASVLHASFVFTLSQVGPDVIVNGAGTLNLSALSLGGIGLIESSIDPSIGYIAVGGSGARPCFGITGPATFGAASWTHPSSFSGDIVGVQGNFPRLFIPFDYVSGSPLLNTMTFSNASFASLGFTPGTYIYTWGSGATADSFTVTSAVPEGGVSALLGIGLSAMCAARWRAYFRQRRSL